MKHILIFRKALLIAALCALSACAAFHPPPVYLPSKGDIEPGETITVKGDESIYGIAREHNVSMRELIALNGLKPPFNVHPGQQLVLPAGGTSFNGNSMPPPSPAPLAPVEINNLSPIEPAGVSAEPLAPLAAPPAAPAQAPASMAPQSLGPQSMAAPPSQPPPYQPPASAAKQAQALEPVQALNRPAAAPQQTATTMSSPAAPAASAAAAVTGESINMVWPVQGPILSAFGSKGAGLNNDGVNIGAPKGAPVVAAAPGTVVYAGNEMKGFGNLVLIRHQGDWVTAYAHLDRVMVKKDSVVGQGDEIGTVGKTGNVASPQLHFETRQNGKPVDPAGVIKNSL